MYFISKVILIEREAIETNLSELFDPVSCAIYSFCLHSPSRQRCGRGSRGTSVFSELFSFISPFPIIFYICGDSYVKCKNAMRERDTDSEDIIKGSLVYLGLLTSIKNKNKPVIWEYEGLFSTVFCFLLHVDLSSKHIKYSGDGTESFPWSSLMWRNEKQWMRLMSPTHMVVYLWFRGHYHHVHTAGLNAQFWCFFFFCSILFCVCVHSHYNLNVTSIRLQLRWPTCAEDVTSYVARCVSGRKFGRNTC